MNWLQPDKLRELYNTAQTGAQIINQVRQQISANVQQQQDEDATLVRAQNELTYTLTTRNSSANNRREANQNLHDGFSKEVTFNLKIHKETHYFQVSERSCQKFAHIA